MDKSNKNANLRVIEAVEEIYQNLHLQPESSGQSCKACGKCCDFESFGHRLYITTPELLYFKTKLVENKISLLPMTDGACPYRKENQCSVYFWRFAGCRIFNCTGDTDLQSSLSEGTIASCKSLCIQSGLEYGYMDLKSALQKIQDMEVFL
jgi:Fe-S-cluster containining protein